MDGRLWEMTGMANTGRMKVIKTMLARQTSWTVDLQPRRLVFGENVIIAGVNIGIDKSSASK